MSHGPVPLKALLLDVGGVLLLPAHDAIRAACERGGFSPRSKLDRAHYAALRTFDLAPADEFYPVYAPAFARTLEVPPDRFEAVVEQLLSTFGRFETWTRVVEGSVATLRSLSGSGVRIAIVSNTQGTMAERLSDLGICQVGDGTGAQVGAIIDSELVGVRKPDPRIFKLAFDALGASCERTVHVGDSVHFDVRGAVASGAVGLHFDPFRLCRQRAHPHIRSLREVIPLLT